MLTLVLENKYIPAALKQQVELMVLTKECELKRDRVIEWRVTPSAAKYRGDKNVTTLSKAYRDTQTGLFDVIYIVDTVKNEPDAFRENAYTTDEEKIERATKNWIMTKEARVSFKYRELKKEYYFEYSDSLKEQPTKIDKAVDNLGYWFVSHTNPETTKIFYIEIGTEVPTIFSLTDEFYAQKHHDAKTMTQEEKDWATVLGWEGDVRNSIKWFMEEYPTNIERLMFVNGATEVIKLGRTTDKQVVICPDCGRPVFASPVMQAYVDKQAKTVPYEQLNQMTCEHCGADLTKCFDIDYTIPAERFVLKEQDSDDEEVDDIFESIAALQTEIDVADFDITDININYIRQAPTELVKKNVVPSHIKATKRKAKAIAALNRAENVALEEMLKKKATSKRSRIQPLSAEAEERAARILAQVKNKTKTCKDIRTAPSDTIEEIRARQQK